VNERKGKGQQSRPKPYRAPADKGKQRVNDERRLGKKDTTAEIVCYTCVRRAIRVMRVLEM